MYWIYLARYGQIWQRVCEWTHAFFKVQLDVAVRVCTYILESLGSIRDRDSAYPNLGFSWFFHPLQVNASLVPRISHDHMQILLSTLCSLRYLHCHKLNPIYEFDVCYCFMTQLTNF